MGDAELGAWIKENVKFPNSMVDRITPATTDPDRALVKDRFGIVDGWPVVAEPYVQWVVEDNFVQTEEGASRRPAWDALPGVQFVKDVTPYELMKLRLLNSSHSALSYASYLCGYKKVDEAMADPLIRGFLQRYMKAIAPTVPPVPGVNLVDYQSTLIRRFSNSRVSDAVLRLAQDGSQKFSSTLALGGLAHSALGSVHFHDTEFGDDLPLFTKWIRNADDFAKIQNWRQDYRKNRMRPGYMPSEDPIFKGEADLHEREEFGMNVEFLPKAEQRDGDPPPADLGIALAAWIRFMTGTDEDDQPIKLDDPLAGKLQPLAIKACDEDASEESRSEAVQAYLSLTLGDAATSWPQLAEEVFDWLQRIIESGMTLALVEAMVESPDALRSDTKSGCNGACRQHAGSKQERLMMLRARRSRLQRELDKINHALAE